MQKKEEAIKSRYIERLRYSYRHVQTKPFHAITKRIRWLVLSFSWASFKLMDPYWHYVRFLFPQGYLVLRTRGSFRQVCKTIRIESRFFFSQKSLNC